MQAENAVQRRESAPFIGSDELAEGLMLVRASTLKLIRFQLASERRDRRAVLEAVDDLVALDRRLEKYLQDVPSEAAQPLRREVEVERTALNREKLTLAAEVIRHREPSAVPELAPETLHAPEPAEWDEFAFEEDEEGRGRRIWIRLLAIAVLFTALGAAAYFLVGPETLMALPSQWGLVS